MPCDTLPELLARLHRAARAGYGLDAAPAAAGAAPLLGLDAVTLDVISADGYRELLWSDPADGLGPDLDDLQYATGEGPTADAARLGRAVVEPDLTATTRWPAFSPAARSRTCAVLAVPLLLGVITVGVLTGYRSAPGPFTPGQLRDVGHFAREALALLLQTPPALLTPDTRPTTAMALHRAEVHQAAGILAVQLDLPVDQALTRLRAHAHRHNLALLEVARDIIAHRLRLRP